MLSIEELIAKIKAYEPNAEIDLIKTAYEFAEKTHREQKRLSGEPFITHPMAVAEILTELEQDSSSVCASLLHDSIEDGGITEKQVSDLFGHNVARLVAGVTKLGKISFGSKEEHQAENYRKMFLAMGEDIRVIVIKLADRLHNMRTLKYLPVEKQKEISLETRDIYAPLCHRLGVWSLKWELEDLAFYYLEKDKFDQIKGLVAQKKQEREDFMKDFIFQVKEAMDKVAINSSISGRTKHFYSIYQKLVQKNVEFDDIYDLIAIRVLVDSVKDCYAVLGVIHSIWKPIPGRFRDFIAMPKPNGYRTLHTTVIGSSGKPVEVQIRTHEMHKAAEYGIAAHWRYKEKGTDKAFDSKLAWLRQMLDYQKDVKDAKDFMESLKIDLFIDEVFVYTPKGDVFSFPVDSTPVDFAYHVHTQVGHRCQGAKVNGKIVPLDYKLKNGDIIDILTGSKENPRFDWLDFVKTSGARAKIKNWLKKQKREDNIERGRLLLLEELNALGVDDPEAVSEENLRFLFNAQNIANGQDLFALIGWGEMSAFATAKKIRQNLEKKKPLPQTEEEILKPMLSQPPKKAAPSSGIRVMGAKNILTRFSKCCYPLPGDEVVGFVTKGKGVSIHKADCKSLAAHEKKEGKCVEVQWDESSGTLYPVSIEVEAFDRVGVLKDILAQISETRTNISSADVKTKKGSSAIITLVVDVKSSSQLKQVMDAIRKVSDVYDVYRATAVK